MIHDATNRSRSSFRSTSHTPGPDPTGPATPAIPPETATAVLLVLIVYPFQQGGRSGPMVEALMFSSLSGHL